ncbi:hypothetical protein MC885_015418 [Smutsia gigantea]|nr:hypothetical protein MC885_015418 [Smutsia gigantea]
MDAALLRSQAQAPAPPSEAWPLVTSDEELYDCLDYYYLRDFPACGAGHSKGRTRRERELRTNWPVPGGHERKIAQKLLNGQRKRHQLQLQPRARTRLSRVPVVILTREDLRTRFVREQQELPVFLAPELLTQTA